MGGPQKRRLAAKIHAIGSTPHEIATRLWSGGDLTAHEQHVAEMAETIRTLAQQHYSYPIVHFFHARHRRTSLPLSVAMLHGACEETVPDHEPPPLTVHLLRTAVEDLLRAVSSAYLTLDHDEGTTAHLRRFVEDDGWDWDAVHDAPVH